MEPTDDNLSGGHCSSSWDYGCSAGTFYQQEEQGEDLMSSLFLLSESQSSSPPSSWLWLEGFPVPESFGRGQISPVMDEMPYIPAAVAAETNYADGPAAPLLATHGTGPGQLSSNSFSLSSTTSDQFDEEEVQQAIKSLLDQSMAPDGLSNTTNGDPAARNHADAVPPLVQQDELRHPQQQLPLLTNNPGAHLSQIQQMTPTIWPSQPDSPSPTPVINPGPDEANHAASAPMGSQGTLLPAAPLQHQETDILSRASTQPRAIKSKGLPSRLQDVSDNLFGMGIDMIRQLGRCIVKDRKENKHFLSTVWQDFWTSICKYCHRLTVICQYCNTVIRNPSPFMIFTHLESCDCYNNNIHLIPASSRSSKETQRSSEALQIKEIAENPSSESESIEPDNFATAAWVGTQGTNDVLLSPRQLHQLQMDGEEQMATILATILSPCELCCEELKKRHRKPLGTWLNLVIRLSESSCCSSTTKSTHDDGFRLKFSKNTRNSKIVHVHSPTAWMDVTENKNHHFPNLVLGIPFVSMSYSVYDYESTPAGCAPSWQGMHIALCALGFRKEFARDLVIHALALVNGCHLRLWSPFFNNKGKSIVAQVGDASSGKRKRKPAGIRAKVWDHFTKEEVEETEGSTVTITMARCNHCGSKLRADSKIHGTNHLNRHIRTRHPEHAKSL